MGTSLTGLTPATTYDALIKVGDNGPLSATAKVLSDGLGNDSPLAMSTSNVGIGTTGPAGTTYPQLYIGANNTIMRGDGDLNIANNGYFSSTWKYATNGKAALIYQYDGANMFYVAPTATANATLTWQERVRIDNDGLKFNGDTASANALDDYEEGTWTMGITFGNGTTGVTFQYNSGTYTKIGRQVTVNGYCVLTSKGSSTGVARVTGLPFTIGTSLGNYGATSLWFANVTFTNQFQGYGNTNDTTIDLREITSLGTEGALTDVDFANNSAFMVGLTYFV